MLAGSVSVSGLGQLLLKPELRVSVPKSRASIPDQCLSKPK
jgi:hypothetical protein